MGENRRPGSNSPHLALRRLWLHLVSLPLPCIDQSHALSGPASGAGGGDSLGKETLLDESVEEETVLRTETGVFHPYYVEAGWPGCCSSRYLQYVLVTVYALYDVTHSKASPLCRNLLCIWEQFSFSGAENMQRQSSSDELPLG